VDRARGRHLYGVGSVPEGELVGELGGLLTAPAHGSIGLWTTPEGYLVTRDHRLEGRSPSRRTAVRWLFGPLLWRDLPIRPRQRATATLARVARLALGARAVSGRLSSPSGQPLGYLQGSDGDGRLALYTALHPVTSDQLLTSDPWEAIDLGYGEPVRLGYLEACAPVTGRLGTARPLLPWASRFGQRVR
jgi:hypothetical protein